MPKALVSYYSRTGNTKKMAARIAEVLESQGLEVDLMTVEDTAPAGLLGYDCIVLGSPTYYGTIKASTPRLEGGRDLLPARALARFCKSPQKFTK